MMSHKLRRLLLATLVVTPLLAACGSTSKFNTANSKSAASSSAEKVLNPSAKTEKKTLTAKDQSKLANELTGLFNQNTNMKASEETGHVINDFFSTGNTGVYFPSAVAKGSLQESHQDISVNIPKQTQKATYRIANHYIVQVYKNQLLMQPVHTVQSVSGISKANQKLNSTKAAEFNKKYGPTITERVRKQLKPDKILDIRYIPMKVVNTQKPNKLNHYLTVQTVEMNQQFKLANGTVKSQNVLMKLYYSSGKATKFKYASSAGTATSTTSTTKGQLVAFTLNKSDDTINYLNEKLPKTAIQTLASNMISTLQK